MVSQVLGDRYEIQQQLGKRAGRRTLLARDLQTQDLVVIKLLSFGDDFEWDDLKLFEREAETLKSLSHPAIPSYLDYFELDSPTGKKFALVQTYVEGKSLEEHLKTRRSFSEADVKQIAKAVLEILIYLHGRQPPVIHRDIKPSNILLHNRSGNSVGEVYLVDFGLVQALAATEGGTITVVGTDGYMPQEQFDGRTVPASDLYSLGATLIYLVTGTHPADLPQKDFQIQFEQVVNLSPAFTDWLKWITEPSLERRLSSAQEALQALEQEQLTRDSALLTVSKPTGSNIKLTKNTDFIEIIMPVALSKWVVGADCLTFLMMNASYALLWSFKGAPPFWLTFNVLYITMSLFPLFVRVRLRIDRRRISLTWKWLGFKRNLSRPAPRQSISRLEFRGGVRRGVSRNLVDINPELVIWAGLNKIRIGEKMQAIYYPSFTRSELEWLASELSQWLGIPITREQLPPADR